MILYNKKSGDFMENKYYWDINNLEEDAKKLLFLAKNETNYVIKVKILKAYNELNYMIQREKIKNKTIPNLLSTMYEVMYDYYFYERYYVIIKKYNDIVNSLNKRKKSIEKSIDLMDEFPCLRNYSNNECMTIMNDFFKNIDKDLYRCFEKIYKNRYNTIYFAKQHNRLDENNISGECININYLDKSYLLIDDQIGIAKIVNLVHELGHAVMFQYNANSKKDKFLTELESTFFEMAFQYDIGKKLDSYESAEINYERINYHNEFSKQLLNQKIILQLAKENDYKLDRKLYSNLKNKYNLTKDDIKASIYSSIICEGIYVISYALALELFNIYRTDKEEAIHLLKVINKMNDYDCLSIINIITPHFKNLEKEIINQYDETEEEIKKTIYQKIKLTNKKIYDTINI